MKTSRYISYGLPRRFTSNNAAFFKKTLRVKWMVQTESWEFLCCRWNYTLSGKTTHKYRTRRVSTDRTTQKENIKLLLSRSVRVKLRGRLWVVCTVWSNSNHTERLDRVKTRDLTVRKSFNLQLCVLVSVRILLRGLQLSSQQHLETSLSGKQSWNFL